MATKPIDLRHAIFDAITAEWAAHIDELEKLVQHIEDEKAKYWAGEPGRRKWSFELELNEWARAGCRRPSGWQSPDTGLRYPHSGEIPDALVTVPGYAPAPVEVALVTSVTEDKWINKMNRDTDKLSRSPYPGLQVIACFSTFDLESLPRWTTWLPRINVWNRDTTMVFRHNILGTGKMLVKGWAIP